MKNGGWSIVVGGVVGALLWAGPVGAQPFPGGLPACQASLQTCTTTLNSCTTNLTQTQGLLRACSTNLETCTTDLGTCQTDLAACQAEPTVVFPGDGVDGATLSYTDNGDGTFTDNNTLLMWETKVPGHGCLHCVGDLYRFPGQTPQEQTASAFLAAINMEGGVGLGGHSDWRIPTPKELQSLVDYSRKSPASSVPGSTGDLYLSSRFLKDDPSHGWVVNFVGGSVIALNVEGFAYLVRAVRGGR